jgi:hypothetical protein
MNKVNSAWSTVNSFPNHDSLVLFDIYAISQWINVFDFMNGPCAFPVKIWDANLELFISCFPRDVRHRLDCAHYSDLLAEEWPDLICILEECVGFIFFLSSNDQKIKIYNDKSQISLTIHCIWWRISMPSHMQWHFNLRSPREKNRSD